MTHFLESDLRTAFAERAAEIPAAAGQRLRAHDYRPRTHAIRPPVAAGALAAAAAAVGAVSFVDLGTSTTQAFAGWSAKPTAAGAVQTSDAVASCRQRLAALPNSAAAANVARAAGRSMSLPPLRSLSPVLSDTRGPFTFLVFANSTANATCISGPGFTSASENGSVRPRAAVPAGGISVIWAARSARAGHAYSFLEGRTGAGVSSVTLHTTDGRAVQASAQNGWFVAWWPGTADATSAAVATGQGTTTTSLPAEAVPHCPPAPGGGAVSCAGGRAAGRAAGSIGQSESGR